MAREALGPPPARLANDTASAGHAAADLSDAWREVAVGDLAAAIDSANRSVLHAADDPELLGWNRLLLGHAARMRGDLTGAAGQLGQGFSLFEEADEDIGRARILLETARVSVDAGDSEAGLDAVGAAVQFLAGTGAGGDGRPDRVQESEVVGGALASVARLARSLGDPNTSLRLLSAAVELGWHDHDTAELADELADELTRADHDAAIESGRALTMTAAVDLALARCGRSR